MMRSFSTLVSILLLVPTVLRGDHVLEYETQRTRTSFITHDTSVENSRQTAFVGSHRGRLDQGSTSFILRSDLEKFWVVFHRTRTYWEFDLPVRLEAEVAEGPREVLEEGSRQSTALAEVTATDEVAEIGTRRAQLWRASVRQPMMGLTRDFEIWLETDLDLASFRELRRAVIALDVLDRGWYDKVLVLEGLPVKQEQKKRSSSAEETTTRTLVSLREESLDEDFYAVPKGYESTDFQLEAVFAIADPQERPLPEKPAGE